MNVMKMLAFVVLFGNIRLIAGSVGLSNSFLRTSRLNTFQWERLDLSAIEQRKVFCSITFHLVAITCVVWSLYVLIDRTSEEMKDGNLDWPFWTKLIVLAVGFTGKWQAFQHLVYNYCLHVEDRIRLNNA